MRPIDQLEKEARSMFRLIGPRVSAAQDESAALKMCPSCTPPAKVYECFICGFACEMQWQYNLHIKINPETCQRYASRWAKRYAEQNS
jgi:hypothetical protein